ncbi:hypothetical protein [Nannocystis punicea]|uniref:Uncharacterized protein n=1 Tax=Nannocystis punicea TaxID=2995304 RepID=A0ABY7H250_9BACT|nr:hypothetical protein [Nannocystis poenicansa]WAS93277.1 hypothetical protein O0S08_44585 [Nannocystis poenicansa]
MNRDEFEAIRDIPDKVIETNIKLSQRANTAPARVADGIVIQNSSGVALRLNISFNPESGAKTLNVCAAGVGPICRLDVDGPAHRPAGRSHKHSLQTPRCPGKNLPTGVQDRPELSGQTISELFLLFCKLAKIEHRGTFEQ